jgi:glutathione S-transferase
MTFWANYLKIDLSSWPHLKAYSERVAARPHVREAMKEEGLTK